MDPMDPHQNWVGTWDMGKTEKRPIKIDGTMLFLGNDDPRDFGPIRR